MSAEVPKESLESSMYWVIGLAIVAVGVPLSITLTLLLSSAAVQWIIRAFALRGSILVFFGVGGLLTVCAFMVPRIKSYVLLLARQCIALRYQQKLNILTFMLILGAAFLVTAIAGGVDITRMMTSPVTFARLVGNRTVDALDRRKQPEGRYKARNSLGEIAGGIAISYLIDLSPFPWNMLIFLAYYKLVTVLIFCIIPTVLSLWALVKLWFARKNLRDDFHKELAKDESESLVSEISSDEEIPFRRRPTDTETVIQDEGRNMRVHRHPNFPQTRTERPIVLHHNSREGHGIYPSV